jgi:flagellar hook-associated protein 1 FlgK
MSLLSIAQTGLAAAQLGLSTTANNISNASTPGYNREQIVQTEGGGQSTGSGFIGSGTEVTTVQRLYNSFLTTQANSAQASYSSLNSNYTPISQINNMLADSTSGLSPAIQGFYDSVQTATADPSAASSLETVITSAQTLASQFQSTSAQLSQLSDGVNSELTSTVQTLNGYATQISSLNQAIQTAEASSAGQPPNGLLDERDEAVANLSQQIGVTVVTQGNNYNVFIGNGQPLVVGTNAYQLTTIQSPTNANQLEIGYVNGGTTTQLPESSLTGGALGGLLQFRSQSLIPAQNAVGQMAIGLADTVNAQQELGQDQSGNPGVAMFSAGSPISTASTNNTGSLQISTSVSDSSALTTANYSLEFDGTNYNLTNLSSNAVVYQGTTFPPPSAVDGLTFTTNGGTPATGDNFLIQPTAAGASGFGVAITGTSQVAMAAPIVTNAPGTNTGTGQISAGVVNAPPPQDANLTQPVTITFNTPPTTYNVTGTLSGTPVTTNVPYVAGGNISYNGWTVQISGAPAGGDTFSVGPNTSGAGDSRNGVLIANLQNSNTLDNGTTSVQGAYSQLVSSVGNQTAELLATSTAANTQLTNATSAQQSVSGVNLDEEASNLLQYQQAYQAAAQVMSAASTLFTSLLADLSAAS